MTIQDAVNWCKGQLGHRDDYDGMYGTQCVDFFNFYYQFLTGHRPYADGVGGDGAKDVWTCNPARFTKVINNPSDPNQLPPQGSIIFWGANMPGSGGYGHVAVVDHADDQHIWVWEEVPGSAVQYTERSWSTPEQHWELGWWVFDGFTSPAPAPQVVIPAAAPAPTPPAPAPAPVITPAPVVVPPVAVTTVPSQPTTTTVTIPSPTPNTTVQPVPATPAEPLTTAKGVSMLSKLKSLVMSVWQMPIVSRAVHTFWQAFLAVFIVGISPIMPMVLGHSYGDAKTAVLSLIGAAVAAGLSAAKTVVVMWWQSRKS